MSNTPSAPPSATHALIGMAALPPGPSPWPTIDPFLFCVHHNDAYPAGNADLGVAASLQGRHVGSDFSARDGWSMYHGDNVPGFPAHPHRGFETVTIVREGFIDHSDSAGATARYGQGDVQWLTAGAGIVHCEMFPMLNQDAGNPTELFQIWLNLPASHKMVPPHFTMFWHEAIPRTTVTDAAEHSTHVVCVAGQVAGLQGLAPPPDSWASQAQGDVAIATIRMQPHARWTLPASSGAKTLRMLYCMGGAGVRLEGPEGQTLPPNHVAQLHGPVACELVNGDAEVELLLLQAAPIGEPVAQYGPFVMNTQAEIHQAFADYRRTEFGGWPWPTQDPVHPREQGRFALFTNGERQEPTT
ncbi:pirin family protein [Curvibacter sp. CHRR-16]|uniref:pirin family protein n=1 Tax=Curvibacter sp. CHRR-16 TaxID=2835872 RepID=UPI001BD92EE4|nr:pirin family protein [Curvibacter sp. CHRR-16]MBT0569477.1 pirin family protein [Curvibacter sp. CHRR-16]